MHRLALSTLAAALLVSTAPAEGKLAIAEASVQRMEDGPRVPPGTRHVPGETVYFSFKVDGYRVSPEEKIRLSYRLDAMDPDGLKLMETVEGKIESELSPEDKEWKPKVRHSVVLPPLADPGKYKIVAVVRDALSEETATLDLPFDVAGRAVARSETLVVRNFGFYREENEREPLAVAAYRPGDAVWARFDITGYKIGEGNRIHVDYAVTVLNPEGKTLFTQKEPTVETDEGFYRKRYVPAILSLNLQSNILPGEYTLVIHAKDHVGSGDFETQEKFRIE
ncbi:MAG: hypothetical protein WD696_11235 [Bryobacteraceae bacterium]